jgi:filamentous hemagglutinin family protein
MNRCTHLTLRSLLFAFASLALLLCGSAFDTVAWAQSAASTVPKGTVPSLRGVVSGSAIISTPVPTATGNTLTITQLNPQVIIDWNSFNIASGSTVQFIQPSSSSSALNRIYSANPTIIEGNLIANGQVFLINQNGILFDRGSQINVNTLYASTLNISNSQFAQGVVGATATTPTFQGGYDSSGNSTSATPTGSILIGAGGPATAAAPKLTSATGGAIVLLAPMINNQSGIISSPDGQVILAAGNVAYLQFPDASDTTLRGLVVQIDAASGPVNISSMITNMGTISAARGNVTLAALAVNQGGVISATTALQKNGSVYLQASTLNNAQVGTVTLLPGSVIETPLDTTDKSTLPVSQSYDADRAQVAITGGTVLDQGSIVSPAGDVSLAAISAAGSNAAATTPRVYLGPTSVINVSGDVANAPLSDQLLTFKVTSNELANSPDQKSGILKGATVTVDLDAGSSLLDLSAYQGAEAQTLAEKATSAGSVTLTSSGDVIQRVGSQVLANAGQINYAGGKEPVTLLVGSDNKVYSITNAPEGLTYTAILGSFTVDHPHWGENSLYSNLVAGLAPGVAAFSNGSDAGSISILPTSGVVLDGSLSADTTIGVDQLTDAPHGGSLTIGTYNPNPGVAQNFGLNNVVFAKGSADTLGAGFTPTSVLPANQLNSLRLSSSLFGSSLENSNGTYQLNGFQTVSIGANQSITVPKDVTLNGALTGSVTLQAQQIDVAGNINAPAGAIALTSLQTVSPLVGNAGYGVQVEGSLSTAGQWSNNIGSGFGSVALPSSISSASGVGGPVSTINGGSIALSLPAGSVSQASSIVVAPHATLDVSAGGSVAPSGKVSGGNGGSIAIASANSTSGANRSVVLDGTLEGYGFGNGGSLSLSVANAVITSAPGSTAQATSGDSSTLALAPSFFDQGGFSSYSIAATGNLDVAAGTQITPQQQNLVLSQGTAANLASGSNVAAAAVATTLPAYSRSPTSIALSAAQGALTIDKGAVIQTDPKATISLTGGSQGGLDLAGKLNAAGGTVNLKISNGTGESSELQVESSASVDVAGVYVQAAPSLLPIPQGTVLGGGTISIQALNGDLVMDSGSVLNVSGAAHAIGMTEPSSVTPLVSSNYTSDAGHISIVANDQVVLGSTLIGHASGDSAGGSFALTYTNRNDTIDSSTLRRIVVTDGIAVDPASQTYTDVALALAPLRAGGFDRLALSGEDAIQFNGPIVNAGFKRGVTLDSQQLSVANGTTVNISGAAVALSNSYGQRYENDSQTGTVLDNTFPSLPIATTAGTGTLNVHASTLDLIGSLTVNGASQIDLVSSGDTRLTGRVVGIPSSETGAALIGGLTTLGDLTMQAAQIYPTTRSSFTINVADDKGNLVPGGSVNILGQPGQHDAVLSAGASLTINADTITQGGSVQVPLGTLALNGASTLDLTPGSTTSTSGNGEIIPYGGTSAGTSWLYASTGNQPLYNALTAPPSKSMSLTGNDVSISKGATVNISGGGNILGIEFVPGSGGSTDALAAANTYAIIPTSNLSTAPVDTAIALTQNLGFSNPSSVYNSIHIGPGGPVPAGTYALLPGYYALLPGAYIVQVQTGSSYASLQSGQTVGLANGLSVVPAYEEVAGTNIRSSQTIGVVVQPGSNANKLADYNQFNAGFFTKVAQSSGQPLPVLPADAGQLTLAAAQTLNIDGSLLTKPGSPTANTAEIDITGSKIAVVDASNQPGIDPGFLEISASSLSGINGSILLGGTRVSTGSSVTVTPDASQIVIANSAASPLEVPELLLAATGSITLNPGSVVEGAGNQPASARTITIDGSSSASGAFIRASNSAPVDVTRSVAPSSAAGLVDIQSGATIGATGSLLIDATGSTTSDGRFAMGPNSALSLVSSLISLGDAPTGTGGLALNQSQLASLNSLGSLQLQSYGAIDVYGPNVVLGGSLLKNLTLDSNSIIDNSGQTGQPGSLVASAQSITLQNSSGTTDALPGTIGSGALTLDAPTVVLGAGSKSIAGFSALTINAQQVEGQGVGQLLVAAPIQINAARVTGGAGANQTWVAADLATGTGVPANYYNVALAPAASSATLASAGMLRL